jgi:hypothetical protein
MFFFTKNKTGILYCGLFGWVGADPKLFSRDKLNIIGIANITRGSHSCGIAIDGKLYKGVEANRENRYDDFLMKSSYPDPKTIPVVIGHTRHATGGQKTEEHAHPFKFQNGKEYMIGAHNGVIKNVDELAKEFGIDKTNKIDSQILLEILSKDNPEVLEKYTGFAALLIYSTEDPTTMWVFRGESKEFKHAIKTEPERPLFFYQETLKSMYISSLEQPLYHICKTKKQKESVFSFRTNILYEIKSGTIKNRYEIDRSKIDHYTNYTSYINNNRVETYPERQHNNLLSQTSGNQGCSVSNTRNTEIHTKYTPNDHKKNNIFYESVIFSPEEREIYYEHLRYKDLDDKLVSGVVIFVEEVGFVLIGNTEEKALERLKSFSMEDPWNSTTIDFGDISKSAVLFYMWDGVLLKEKMDFMALSGHLSKNGKEKVDFSKLSFMSQYPIIDISRFNNEKIIYPNTQRITENNHMATGTFSPLGSMKTYTVKFGKLESSTILRDITLPPKDTRLSMYYDGVWLNNSQRASNNINDDNDDFETDLENQIGILKETDIDTISELTREIDDHFEYVTGTLEDLNQDSLMVKTVSEFNNDSIKRFLPIKKMIKDIEEKTIHNEQ